jgi:hypothetical protein
MPDDLGWDSFDRRHFMVTAMGASAVLAASTDPASAQAATKSRGTVYTGDMIDGKKVISALNVDDLESSKKHLFYFQGVETTTGQHWHVSTIVAKPRDVCFWHLADMPIALSDVCFWEQSGHWTDVARGPFLTQTDIGSDGGATVTRDNNPRHRLLL